jgi:hypothetical protein
MRDDVVAKEELNGAVAARRELGEEMEPAVIDAFVQRIEARLADSEQALKRKRDHQKEMILGSMGSRSRCWRSRRSSRDCRASRRSASRSP